MAGAFFAQIKRLAAAISAGLGEYYHAPYRATFRRAAREEDDLFDLLVASELLGIPNPVSFYTLELMPLIYEDFHDWHTRMGMQRSPLDGIGGIGCC